MTTTFDFKTFIKVTGWSKNRARYFFRFPVMMESQTQILHTPTLHWVKRYDVKRIIARLMMRNDSDAIAALFASVQA